MSSFGRVLVACCVVLAACAGPVRPLHPFAGIRTYDCAPPDPVAALEVTYLGAGGFLMRWRGHAIMTAPFYSNPNLLEVGLGYVGYPIDVDRDRVDALLPKVDDVEAILVGHAHYDHLMDTVYVAQRWAPHARLYGSRTMVNQLVESTPLGGRLCDVERGAGDEQTLGTWHAVAGAVDHPAIRVMALRSEHAPHFLGVKLFDGHVDTPAAALPRTAAGWVEGQTLAFLIEFLRADGSVALRLHYQDAASTPDLGFPPAAIKGYDVAIVCAASFANVPDYPGALLARLDPRRVVLAHWENFFQDPEAPLRVVPATDGAALARRLDDALGAEGDRWITPRPGATVRVCAEPHAVDSVAATRPSR